MPQYPLSGLSEHGLLGHVPVILLAVLLHPSGNKGAVDIN